MRRLGVCAKYVRTITGSAKLRRQSGIFVGFALICAVGGCTSWNKEVAPVEVAPHVYANLTCKEISSELKKLRRLTTPVLFPSPDWEVQLALKKGTIKTLEKVSADKNCASD